MMARACSSDSPMPKKAGADPTPPKPPHPRPIRDTATPVLPSDRYCIAGLYRLQGAVATLIDPEAGVVEAHVPHLNGVTKVGVTDDEACLEDEAHDPVP